MMILIDFGLLWTEACESQRQSWAWKCTAPLPMLMAKVLSSQSSCRWSSHSRRCSSRSSRSIQEPERLYILALFKSPSGGGLTKMGSVTFWGPLDTSFCSLKLLGPGDLRKQVCLGHQTLHYAKFWAQNATKTSAGNIPESLSNLFLRDNCRLLQRLLNNANLYIQKTFLGRVRRSIQIDYRQTLGVLSHHLNCEMKSPHFVDFSWDFVDFSRILVEFWPIFSWF